MILMCVDIETNCKRRTKEKVSLSDLKALGFPFRIGLESDNCDCDQHGSACHLEINTEYVVNYLFLANIISNICDLNERFK
uniref:Uncharacterized protein n=1 Tax=Onchocerca volvulus TaxID=6282 RepID=A0A8R1XPZ5_ONCVO